ncbi:MAG: T9SS type A sorting domain-containing protein [Chitinophagales bacterium]|nr:T9SS type A sorting domain-containing protein [Chitinophagales bacterium]
MKKVWILCSVFFMLNTLLQASCGDRYLNPIFTNIKITKDIQYGAAKKSNGIAQDLLMDIYEPEGDTLAMRPLMIYLHGGSFFGGDKNVAEASLICNEFAKRGYVAVSIDYRLENNPLVLAFPEIMIKAVMRAVQDSKAAVRYFRKDYAENDNQWRINPSEIFLGGASAGAITAIHHAYMDDINELEPDYQHYVNFLGGMEGNSGNPGYSSWVKAVVNVSGCIRDQDYMNNNTTIPIYSMHSVGDLTIPYGYGFPYYIPTLPIVAGSKQIHERTDSLGMHALFISLPGNAHVPYKDGDVPLQPGWDTLWNTLPTFLYQFLSCNPDYISVGVIQNYQAEEVQLYPNPVTDVLILKDFQKLNSSFAYQIIDNSGKVIAEGKHLPEQLNIKNLSITSGVYFLHIIDTKENHHKIGRFIVK